MGTSTTSAASGAAIRIDPRPRAGWPQVLLALTESDLRARYGRGSGRYLKWLLDPFAAIGIYLVLVTFVVSRAGRDPGLSLACAVVPFQLVINTVVNATSALELRRSIVLNMGFRRSLIPLSTVATESVAFLGSLSLIVLMMAVYGRAPTVDVLFLPLVLLTTAAFAVGLAYPSSLLGVWFPDLRHFVISAVRTTFFVAPGLVPLAEIHGRARTVLQLNPLSGLFEAYRDVLFYGRVPAAWHLLYPLGFSALLLVVFVPIYQREQRQFAKVVE